MSKRVVTLAHYYTQPEIQQMADKVGDSLELSLFARESKADIIVFAGVRFMAETAKILNPQAEVILPDAGSTCSLVTQTDVGCTATVARKPPRPRARVVHQLVRRAQGAVGLDRHQP